jgi:intracellular sulfur oxidation DsrE/DsrF family protein
MRIRQLLTCTALMFAAGLAWAQDKVVYHVNDTATQAIGALRNIRNQLDTEPNTKIVLVAHAQGVDFLMEGAKDRNGSPYAGPVSALKSRGVTFEVCEITLKSRDLKKEQFIQEVDFTPSGVVRITKLQMQGYAYLKP